MRKNEWRLSRRIEKRYTAAIANLMKGLQRELKHATSPFQMLSIMRGLARSPTVKKAALKVAYSMVTAVFRDTRGTWRQAAMRGAKGRTIYKILRRELRESRVYKDLIRQNAMYISRIPLDVAERMTGKVARLHEKGMRPESMTEELLKLHPDMTESRARLIARTESGNKSY